jgi:hypothetical protein
VHIEEPSDDEEDVHMHGFSTDDDDSSDEDDPMGDKPSAFDVSKLPTIVKDDATVKRQLVPIAFTGLTILHSGRYPPSRFVTQARDLSENDQSNFTSVTNYKVIIGDENIFSESQKKRGLCG